MFLINNLHLCSFHSPNPGTTVPSWHLYVQQSCVWLPTINLKCLGGGWHLKFQQFLRLVASVGSEPCHTWLVGSMVMYFPAWLGSQSSSILGTIQPPARYMLFIILKSCYFMDSIPISLWQVLHQPHVDPPEMPSVAESWIFYHIPVLIGWPQNHGRIPMPHCSMGLSSCPCFGFHCSFASTCWRSNKDK